MSDPINTTSGCALDGLTRLEILEVLRQQAWLALNENAAQGGISVSKLGDYILDLSDAIDKRINENAEKLKAEKKARSEAGISPLAEVTTAGPFSERLEYEGDTVAAKVHTAGPFAKREEYTPKTGDTLRIVVPISSKLPAEDALAYAMETAASVAVQNDAELKGSPTTTLGNTVDGVKLDGCIVFDFTATKK